VSSNTCLFFELVVCDTFVTLPIALRLSLWLFLDCQLALEKIETELRINGERQFESIENHWEPISDTLQFWRALLRHQFSSDQSSFFGPWGPERRLWLAVVHSCML